MMGVGGALRSFYANITFGMSSDVVHKKSYLCSVLYLQISGPEVIKTISCSTQLSMKMFLLINVKMPTFKSRKNTILGLSKPEKC